MRITEVELTPVAVNDPPLLNSKGVHQPYALRTVIQVRTDAGLTGLGETYGGDRLRARLQAAAPRLRGLDPFDLNGLRARLGVGLMSDEAPAIVLSAFEVPCLDLAGRACGRPVSDLLGGRVRDQVPYAAYLFYRWEAHPGQARSDEWGAALDPDGIVAQARRMVERHGFGSLKLKGGVMPPDQEVDAILALRDAFPELPLRLDPNAGWTVATAIVVARRLEGRLEYLEDPTGGIGGMAEVARATALPLATNMCVVGFPDIRPAVAAGAVDVVLADHHSWGGLLASRSLAAICESFGIGLSMHSNTHLGISLAAMTHLAAATPHLSYACDTHAPWQVEDVIAPGALAFRAGAVAVPAGPGLGVSLDLDALARLHEQWLHCGIRERDDAGAMRVVDPHWTGRRPRY